MSEALGILHENGSTIVSTRRGADEESRWVEEGVLASEEAKRWAEEGRLRLLGGGDEEWVSISSTEVREAIKGDDKERLKGLVMDEVAEYVEKEGLYR